MRVSIRVQLGVLVLLCSLLSLMVLALAVWFNNYSFVIDIRLSSLSLTASLKAAQLASTLVLYQSQTQAVSTRILVQSALSNYNHGNKSSGTLDTITTDLESALANGQLLVQMTLFPQLFSGNYSALNGLVNVTASNLIGNVQLPYGYPNGSPVYLGDPDYGYPPSLYPNLTYNNSSNGVVYESKTILPGDTLFLGPLIVNNTYSLLSLTMAVLNNTNTAEVLGWQTIVVDASRIYDIQSSPEGLGETGQVLIIGPERADNKFSSNIRSSTMAQADLFEVRFLLPPENNVTLDQRHDLRSGVRNSTLPFPMEDYPAVVDAWTTNNHAVNNAGALISTHNEQGAKVSAGYAVVSDTIVDWVLVVEQSYDEVIQPITHLRNVVLICVFSVTGLLLVVVVPLAHYSVTPIRQLRAATLKTVEPYLPEDASEYSSTMGPLTTNGGRDDSTDEEEIRRNAELAKKEGFFHQIIKHLLADQRPETSKNLRRRRTFRIPSKVPERKHLFYDELTDLTSTFNEMSDELQMQYERLEERVKQRTAELEKSKKAAEAANQSKTLFIANISHELKTPLNGILGLTTVCMNEEDLHKIRSTLSTIYKSGDLLLHLLTDLLTFSKNEVGQQLAIDESPFRLNDLGVQLVPTFDKQAREAQVKLEVLYIGTNDQFGNSSDNSGDKLYGPAGTGRVKDMYLYGDKNRILQVLLNFVSNSLKFTPAHGSVTVRVRCVGIHESPSRPGSYRKSSITSKKSKSSSTKRVRMSDASLAGRHGEPDSDNEKTQILNFTQTPNATGGTTLNVNVGGENLQLAQLAARRRSMSPPPLNTKDLVFEFEVEDTGPGIPPEQQKKIFEPFVQGDLGLSKKYGGTGLGLSICAQLAALMGGEISLDSSVGVGSKFAMRIPLRYISERTASKASSVLDHADAESHISDSAVSTDSTQKELIPPDPNKMSDVPRIVGFTQPYLAKEANKPSKAKMSEMKKAESEAAKQGRKIRVLVAEDNKVNQEVVLRMLKLEDVYDVTIAKDGQEAFDRVRESMQKGERYDLVFMDVQMPNVDGIQSTKLIRGMGFSAPIVALTAFAEKSNEDECMASGMDFFLAKPIRRPALKQVLKKYCATIPEEESDSSMVGDPKANGEAIGSTTDGGPSQPKRSEVVDPNDYEYQEG